MALSGYWVPSGYWCFYLTWEHSISLSRSFLQMKSENQNDVKMTWIWLESWHLRSRINLWCKHKFTNVVLSLCCQTSKLTVWHFYMPISSSTYHCSHLSKNGGSKVVELIYIVKIIHSSLLLKYFKILSIINLLTIKVQIMANRKRVVKTKPACRLFN